MNVIAYEDIEAFFDHVERLEAVAAAARAYEQATRNEAGFGERGKLFRAMSRALDELDKETTDE